MKIFANGGFIVMDEGDDHNDAYNLMCVCGHKASEHGMWMSWATHTFFMSQCVMCPLDAGEFMCPRFRIAEIIDGTI